MPPSLSTTTALAVGIMGEAQGEPLLGKWAVAKVIWNRTKLRFSSDGTIKSTLFWDNQFDCFYYTFTPGQGYHRIAYTPAGAEEQAATLLMHYLKQAAWRDCLMVAGFAAGGDFTRADKLPPLMNEAVYYYNPDIVHDAPLWATPEAHIMDVGQHSFYRS
jgi:hypothetical protein